MTRKLRIFLCHATEDKPAARTLYESLKSVPWINPWLDEENLWLEGTSARVVCGNYPRQEGFYRDMEFGL
ncbi:MAG: hypothetical protein HY867_07040 [Chloroflexi bacterium]|nr:hypothetical protein [Chloroflexota bacterium]